MKVFILICVIAILLLISRVYYEKQVEGLDTMNSETKNSDPSTDTKPKNVLPSEESDVITKNSSTPIMPEPNTKQNDENEEVENDEDDENKYDPLKIIEKMDKIKKLTSGVKKQMALAKEKQEEIVKNPKNLEEHGDFCNCKLCTNKNNFYINQHFHNYAPPVETKKTPLAGGLLSDEFDNVNFFLNKLSTSQLNKKNRGKNFAEFGTKLKPRKTSKPKYAKMESVTGMFTNRGPKPFNY